jgi:hypothetical protein
MATAQPVIRYDLDHDLRAVEAMAERLVPYVYETELYGQMPGDMPRLTLGGLLMRLYRLSAISSLLTPEQQQRLRMAKESLEKTQTQWRVAYEGKIQQELPARIKSLEQFARSCMEIYPSGIEKRVMAEVLKDEAERLAVLSPETRLALTNVDGKIRRNVKPGGSFIWDRRLELAYPRDKYWFLYVTF